ncbi:hypothetical protein FB451DRAFT_1170574 [Mycena latifolia]|nr:hypothetical protein FB451DRAFT_1170574 [Mycena latifolia]
MPDETEEKQAGKPLPTLPAPSRLLPTTMTKERMKGNGNRTPPTTLAVDARAHRARIVRHVLSNADPALQVAEVEAWARALEGALDALGNAVARGRWLPRRRGAGEKGVARMKTTDGDGEEGEGEGTDALIRTLAAAPSPDSSAPTHFVLCATPANADRCIFTPGSFALDDPAAVLYDGWADTLVGGTFTLASSSSASAYPALRTALRVAVYLHLTLLLEQHFLFDSGVKLHFPPPPKPKPVLALPALSAREEKDKDKAEDGRHGEREGGKAKGKAKGKAFLPGILSFGKRNSLHLQRNRVVSPRSGSLDLSYILLHFHGLSPGTPTPTRERRFSFTAPLGLHSRFAHAHSPLTSSSSFTTPTPTNANTKAEAGSAPFSAALTRLVSTSPLLSSSANVRWGAPGVVMGLAARERERAFPSLTKWEGGEGESENKEKESGNKEGGSGTKLEAWAERMKGAQGFARMQGLSVVLSRNVPASASTSEGAAASSLSSSSAAAAGAAGSTASVASSTSTHADSAECIRGDGFKCRVTRGLPRQRSPTACSRPVERRFRLPTFSTPPPLIRALGKSSAGYVSGRRSPVHARGVVGVRVVRGGVRIEVRVGEDDTVDLEETKEGGGTRVDSGAQEEGGGRAGEEGKKEAGAGAGGKEEGTEGVKEEKEKEGKEDAGSSSEGKEGMVDGEKADEPEEEQEDAERIRTARRRMSDGVLRRRSWGVHWEGAAAVGCPPAGAPHAAHAEARANSRGVVRVRLVSRRDRREWARRAVYVTRPECLRVPPSTPTGSGIPSMVQHCTSDISDTVFATLSTP